MIDEADFFLVTSSQYNLIYPMSGALSEEMNLTMTWLPVRENKWDRQCHIYSIFPFYFDNQLSENAKKKSNAFSDALPD